MALLRPGLPCAVYHARKVEQMLDLHKRLAAAQDAGERERLGRLIDATDRQIDALVYDQPN